MFQVTLANGSCTKAHAAAPPTIFKDFPRSLTLRHAAPKPSEGALEDFSLGAYKTT